jgi:hypothetical protein
MWLNPTTRKMPVDVAKQDFSKVKTGNPGEDQSQERDKKITCFYCGKPNHKKSDYRIYKRDLAEGKVANKNEQKGENVAAMTAECEQGEDCLINEDEECYSVVRDDAMSWVVNSGASFHITSHKEYFTSYTNGVTGQVRMGNSGSLTIVGKGIICIETNTGCRLVLDKVRHIPDIQLNLLSVVKLDDIRHGSYFGDAK